MHVLLVCTGNTCRSPLAEVLLRARLQASPTLSDVTVASAGTGAWAGTPASEGSYLIALERGLDLSSHRATPVTSDLVKSADVVLTMGRSHAATVSAMGGAGKVHTLVDYAGRPADMAADVADPIGGDVDAYRHTADVIDRLLHLAVQRLERERAS